jgi:hypothetical protein
LIDISKKIFEAEDDILETDIFDQQSNALPP